MDLKSYLKIVEKFLKDDLEEAHCERYVLGVSGGVDSSLCAAILKSAVGRDKVHCLIMPIDSSEADTKDGLTLVKDLDLPYDVIDANGEIENYFNSYILFICSCIEVKKIFLPFVRDYLNSKDTFLNTYEIAEQFAKFEKEHGKRFDKLECSFDSFNYTVFKDSNGKNILCEKIVFPDISSFFFYDLFSGIKKNYIPNYCRNCGKFFHISGGKYLLYCNSPVKGKSGKTCKELGSQRRYNDKCKNDPVWQTYNRAYKTHYARYMKKRMTTAEFEQWSRFASELRDKAEKEEITFEEYHEQIRE